MTANEINQLWEFTLSSTTGYYYISPIKDRTKRLTAPGIANGAYCTFTAASSSSTTQLWKLNRRSDNDWWWISPYANSTKALEIEFGNIAPKSGRVAQIKTYNSSVIQMSWQFEINKPFEPGQYNGSLVGLEHAYSSYWLDYDDYSEYPFQCPGGGGWWLTYSFGYYEIAPMTYKNKRLYAANSYDVLIDDAENITNSFSTKWIILPYTNYRYRITPLLYPTKGLDVASLSNEATAELYTFYDTSDWAKWYINTGCMYPWW